MTCVGQRLQRGEIENLDVADDVGRSHQLPDRERRFLPPRRVAGEVLDVEAGDGELVGAGAGTGTPLMFADASAPSPAAPCRRQT